jgi:hypothetical protein
MINDHHKNNFDIYIWKLYESSDTIKLFVPSFQIKQSKFNAD